MGIKVKTQGVRTGIRVRIGIGIRVRGGQGGNTLKR